MAVGNDAASVLFSIRRCLSRARRVTMTVIVYILLIENCGRRLQRMRKYLSSQPFRLNVLVCGILKGQVLGI